MTAIPEWELAKLLEGTSDAAFTVDIQGEIRTWNKSAEKLFGHPSSFALGKSCATLVAGRNENNRQVCCEHCDVLECVRKDKDVSNFDMQICNSLGERRWVNVSILVASNERTERRLAIHFMRDIGNRKNTEDLTKKVLQVARSLVSSADEEGEMPPVSSPTEQETKILNLLADGKTSKEVADELNISARTLRNHISHINQKLHTNNRLEAVLEALKRGII